MHVVRGVAREDYLPLAAECRLCFAVCWFGQKKCGGITSRFENMTKR